MFQTTNNPVSPSSIQIEATDEEYPVRWVTLTEFNEGLALTTFQHFQDRLKHFLNQFSPIPKPCGLGIDYHQVWINFPEGNLSAFQEEFNLDIKVFYSPFESNTLTQNSSGENETQSFLHIKVFDEDEYETPLIQLRVNPQGNTAEIVYVQKGSFLSGTQMKELALSMLNALKPDLVYLNDDAKFTFDVPNSMETLTVPIRSYLPIISPQGETWYGKDGFSPLQCNNLQTSDPHIKKTQDPTEYYRSVALVRNTSLKDLYQYILPEESKNTLLDLCARYLPKINLSNIDKNIRRLANVNLHNLGCEIYNSMRTNQGKVDFAQFYQKIICNNSDSALPFYEALEEMYLTSIWKFSYKSPQNNSSYQAIRRLFKFKV